MKSIRNIGILGRSFIVLALLLVFAGKAGAQLITVKPGQLFGFVVSAPEEAISGEDFFLQVKATDQNGNIITNYSDIGKSVKLISGGSQQLMPNTLSATSFIGGVATVKAVYYKAEDIMVTVKDFSDAAAGTSSTIRVKPNTIHHFSVKAPDAVTAGDDFGVEITALDAYNNIMTEYSALGKGVNISTSGTSKISPNFIAASSFGDGIATVTFSYNKAENITVNLSEKDRPDISKSNRVDIRPSSLERFLVTTEGVAIAGKSFTLKIKAVDAYDNVINNYNEIGKDVILATTGSGELSPNVASAASFVDGLATVEVSYNRAESFSINAYQEGMEIDIKKKAPPRKVEEKPVTPQEPAAEPAREDFSDLLIVE